MLFPLHVPAPVLCRVALPEERELVLGLFRVEFLALALHGSAALAVRVVFPVSPDALGIPYVQ